MKVKKLAREHIHMWVSQQFTALDGDSVVWFVGRDPQNEGACIYAACGSAKEISDWVEELKRKQGQDIRRYQVTREEVNEGNRT